MKTEGKSMEGKGSLKESKTNKAGRTKNRKGLTMEGRRNLEALMFLSPWIIGTCVFFISAIFSSVRLSFSEIVQLSGFVMEWRGTVNYQNIFMYDINFMPTFISVITNTLINTPLVLVFSLIIAMLINRPVPGRGFFRTCFFIPVLLGSGYIMAQLLQIDATGSVGVGITLPQVLHEMLGNTLVTAIQPFLDRITLILWKSGVQIILFLAGLQGISSSLYEAAKCDGATQWEMFWKITLPMISPIILLNFVYTLVMYFTSSDNDLVKYILDTVFSKIDLARGAAMGWVYFLFIFVLCGVVFGVVRLGSKEKEA
jgi:ABC-type sugar transport system permease subunit